MVNCSPGVHRAVKWMRSVFNQLRVVRMRGLCHGQVGVAGCGVKLQLFGVRSYMHALLFVSLTGC